MKKNKLVLEKLAKGDEVYTKSGFIGEIHGINDKVVTLEVSDAVRFKILKDQIAGLAKSILELEKK